jgi:cytochrome c553
VGQLPLLAAEKIDHTAPYAEEIKPAYDAALYGKYLAVTCTGCHTDSFKGAPARSPQQPPVPDITSTGNMGKWTQHEFVNVFRTGTTPEGRVVSQHMKAFTYSDEQLRAIYLYLHELRN